MVETSNRRATDKYFRNGYKRLRIFLSIDRPEYSDYEPIYP